MSWNKEYKSIMKTMGGFIFVYYEKDKPLFYNLNMKPQNIFRILTLASYLDYDGTLVTKNKRNEKVPMTRKHIKKELNLSDSIFKSFLYETKGAGILIEHKDKFEINSKYINRGKRLSGNSTRLFTMIMKQLCKNYKVTEHRQLGKICMLIPFLNNDNEMDIKYFCDILDIDISNRARYIKILSEFKMFINNEKYQIFSKEKNKIKIHEGFTYQGGNLNPIINITKYTTKTKHSKNEIKIMEYLNSKNEFYITEMIFIDLVSDLNEFLRYDFYLPKRNTLIEFDGEYHDSDIRNNPKQFHRLKEHDRMKDEYAEKIGIKLVRIHWSEKDNIEKILDNIIND